MRTFRVDHLGCKVNHYEAQALGQGLQRLGLREASPGTSPDLLLLNTCAVTSHAEATSRNRVRRAYRQGPRTQILVTGCYAEAERVSLEGLQGVVRVFGNAEKDEILPFVARDLLGNQVSLAPGLPALTRAGGQTRAFVKVEDGCDDRCTFCIIPTLRGPARSRSAGEIVAEVESLAAGGHREVVLTGVHLGYFGKEESARGPALLQLLRRLVAVPGLARLRLSSLEVQELNPELIDLFASSTVLAPHFHLPLQSGSDRVLAAMRRKYRTDTFRRRVETLRARLERPAISTDVMVGFPGESDHDFRRTLDLCRCLGFMKLHVFPYSPRRGTLAAGYPEHVPAAVMEARKQALLDLNRDLGRVYRRGFIGDVVSVLVEGRREPRAGRLTGLTERYVRVHLPGPDRLKGSILEARIHSEGEEEALLGERVAMGVEAP